MTVSTDGPCAERRLFLRCGITALAIAGAPRLWAAAASRPVPPQQVDIEMLRRPARAPESRGSPSSSRLMRNGRHSSRRWPIRWHVSQGTEMAYTGRVRAQSRRWPVSVHLLRHRAVRFEDKIRIGHRMAEFLEADLGDEHREEFSDHILRMATRCDLMPALRCASGPRIRRRACAHGTALLHELRGAAISCLAP